MLTKQKILILQMQYVVKRIKGLKIIKMIRFIHRRLLIIILDTKIYLIKKIINHTIVLTLKNETKKLMNIN
jgi:hypothetical protein